MIYSNIPVSVARIFGPSSTSSRSQPNRSMSRRSKFSFPLWETVPIRRNVVYPTRLVFSSRCPRFVNRSALPLHPVVSRITLLAVYRVGSWLNAGATDGFHCRYPLRGFPRLVGTLPGNNRALSVVEAPRRCKSDLPSGCFANPIPQILRASTRNTKWLFFAVASDDFFCLAETGCISDGWRERERRWLIRSVLLVGRRFGDSNFLLWVKPRCFFIFNPVLYHLT